MTGNPLDGVLATVTAPIRAFLDDPAVTDIMLNPNGSLWIQAHGLGRYQADVTVRPDVARTLLALVASDNDAALSRDTPMVSGTLPHWHARVQGLLPPLVASPSFSLRMPPSVVYSIEDYVEKGILSEAHREFIENAVLARRNIIVAGGTGSGKTTFANALLRIIAHQTTDRVYVIEDTSELQFSGPNVVAQRTFPGCCDTRMAVYLALRANPDRIIVGEMRDGAAYELLKAWGTGHSGGVATVHANDAASVPERLCALSEEVVANVPRSVVADALDICIHLEARGDARRVTGIIAVDGYDARASRWETRPVP